jgi:hypothetical protein
MFILKSVKHEGLSVLDKTAKETATTGTATKQQQQQQQK